MIRNRIIAGLLTLSLFSSCAQSLSDSEKASLKAIRIPEGRTKSDAYHPPQSITQESAATIGFVSGLTLGLAGGLIAGAGVAAKQHGFESKHKSEMERIKAGTPVDLGKTVAAELNTTLSKDRFFGPRLKATGPAAGRINVEIVSYLLQKVSGGHHSPSIALLGKITGPHGDDCFLAFSGADGYSPAPVGIKGCSAPLSVYADNPALLRTHYQQVAAQAARNLGAVFKEEVGSDEEDEAAEADEEEKEDEEGEPQKPATVAVSPASKSAS